MNDSLFYIQQTVASHLLDLLENQQITTERVAELAKQVIAIIPENEPLDSDHSDINLNQIKEQLLAIPELSELDLTNLKLKQ